MVAIGMCLSDKKLHCYAWDGTGDAGGGPLVPVRNLAHPHCKPKTCGYSRVGIEMRPLVAESDEKTTLPNN